MGLSDGLEDWAFKQHLSRCFLLSWYSGYRVEPTLGVFFTLQDPCVCPLCRVQVIRAPIYWHDLGALVGTICLLLEVSNN